jgi:hypothetical protein
MEQSNATRIEYIGKKMKLGKLYQYQKIKKLWNANEFIK